MYLCFANRVLVTWSLVAIYAIILLSDVLLRPNSCYLRHDSSCGLYSRFFGESTNLDIHRLFRFCRAYLISPLALPCLIPFFYQHFRCVVRCLQPISSNRSMSEARKSNLSAHSRIYRSPLRTCSLFWFVSFHVSSVTPQDCKRNSYLHLLRLILLLLLPCWQCALVIL